AAGALAAVGDAAAAVLAAEAVGAAGHVLERIVACVRQRERAERVERAVGAFPAVKHRLADLYVQVRAARSAAHYAAWATIGSPSGGAARSAPSEGRWRETGERLGGLALAQALEALRTAAAEGVQLPGGTGSTWENEAYRYFHRAVGDELLFGPVHRLRAYAADAARLFDGREVTV
ncbi:acyl-CoA dehydrogenase family protein, partial [Streptomyces sporangiiformans]